jgi:Uma2 family endonuclease
MGTLAVVPVSEYLNTTYRPDRDYIDGELKERSVGEQPHGDVQMILGAIFRANRLAWGTRPLGDTRLQITPTRYRIPDVMVLRNTDPKDGIIRFIPLLCVEILSKDDRLNDIRERVADYVSVGTKDVWVIDPWKRVAYEEGAAGLALPEDGVLRVRGTEIAVAVAEIFRQLDEF